MKAEGRARRRRYNRVHEQWRRLSRPAKLAVPATLIALLTAGVVASATSVAPTSTAAQPTLQTQPSLQTRASAVSALRDDTLERTSRLLQSGRPALTSAASEAAAAEVRQQKKDDVKAADRKANKKAVQKKADKKEAALKKKDAAARAKFTPTRAQLKVKGSRYTRVSLNVRSQPKSSAHLVTVLKKGSKLKVTRTTKNSWTLVIHRGTGRWVHTEYLVKKKPSTSSSSGGGISGSPCSSGSGMESGLTKDAIRVHRAVCAKFPSIKSYGGMRSGGDSFHTSGRAVDIMVSGSKGHAVAAWVRANRKRLGVSEIIYAQKIWTVQRGGEGWRSMSSRGNATANHYDHVHVSVYGNSAAG